MNISFDAVWMLFSLVLTFYSKLFFIVNLQTDLMKIPHKTNSVLVVNSYDIKSNIYDDSIGNDVNFSNNDSG